MARFGEDIMPTQSHPDSFKSLSTLSSSSFSQKYNFFRLKALEGSGVSLTRLPFSLRILLENLLRRADARTVTKDDIQFLACWEPHPEPARAVAYIPARAV